MQSRYQIYALKQEQFCNHFFSKIYRHLQFATIYKLDFSYIIWTSLMEGKRCLSCKSYICIHSLVKRTIPRRFIRLRSSSFASLLSPFSFLISAFSFHFSPLFAFAHQAKAVTLVRRRGGFHITKTNTKTLTAHPLTRSPITLNLSPFNL